MQRGTETGSGVVIILRLARVNKYGKRKVLLVCWLHFKCEIRYCTYKIIST
jgi:hypothetical protein